MWNLPPWKRYKSNPVGPGEPKPLIRGPSTRGTIRRRGLLSNSSVPLIVEREKAGPKLEIPLYLDMPRRSPPYMPVRPPDQPREEEEAAIAAAVAARGRKRRGGGGGGGGDEGEDENAASTAMTPETVQTIRNLRRRYSRVTGKKIAQAVDMNHVNEVLRARNAADRDQRGDDEWTREIARLRAAAQPPWRMLERDEEPRLDESPPRRGSSRRPSGISGWSDDSSVLPSPSAPSSSSLSSGQSGGADDGKGEYRTPEREFAVRLSNEDEDLLRRRRMVVGVHRDKRGEPYPLGTVSAQALAKLIKELEQVNDETHNARLGTLVSSLKTAVRNAWFKRYEEKALKRKRAVEDQGVIQHGQKRIRVLFPPPTTPTVDFEEYPGPRVISLSPESTSSTREYRTLLDKVTGVPIPLRQGRHWSPLDEDPFVIPTPRERDKMNVPLIKRSDQLGVTQDDLEFEDGAPASTWVSRETHLGLGGQAVVHKLWHKRTGMVYAVKFFVASDRRPDRQIAQQIAYNGLLKEIQRLRELQHSRVIEAFGSSHRMKELYLILELMDGDVRQAMLDGLMGTRQIWKMFIDVLSGLEAIHGKSVIHHDLTMDNIMFQHQPNLDGPDHFTFKIADFGMSRNVGRGLEGSGKASTLPPELVLGRDDVSRPPHTETVKIDIWTLFVILTEFWDPHWGIRGDMRHYHAKVEHDNEPYARYLNIGCDHFVIRYHFREWIEPLRPWSAMMSWFSSDRPSASRLLELARQHPEYNFSLWDDTHEDRYDGCMYDLQRGPLLMTIETVESMRREQERAGLNE